MTHKDSDKRLIKELDDIQRDIWAIVSQTLMDRGVKMTIGDAYCAGQDIKLVLHPRVKSFLHQELDRARKEAFKSALRADKRYPAFANPSIGSISYRDWLKKQINK